MCSDELLALLINQQAQTLQAMQALTAAISESNKISNECLILLTEMVAGDEEELSLGSDRYLDDGSD